ncbi:MAG: hypothetical protein OQJ91_08715 [Motiliproteus sp.]|nr:hypothetical protein [Motiliproteus sp.]
MWMLNRVCFAISLVIFAVIARAETDGDQSSAWQWGGYLTQGWSISDRNNFFGRSSNSNGSFSFRELGFNANYQWTNQVSVSGQALSRWAGEVDDADTNIDYLFADWAAIQDSRMQAGIRVGRIKNTIGFYNETRDVAFTRPSALLPQSIYQDRIRELLLSSDGVGAYLHSELGPGDLQFNVQFGRPQVGRDSELALLGRDWDGQFINEEMFLSRILYEHNGGQFRFGFTWVDASSDFDGRGSDPFSTGLVDLNLIGISVQLNNENISLTAELVQETVERKDFGGIFTQPKNVVEAFYVQADLRLNYKWTLFARYDEVIADKNDKDGSRFNSLTGLPAHQRFAKDWTIGVGYKPTPNLLLRGEVHHVDGTAWLSSLDNPNPVSLKQDWNLFLFQASYRF